jgi:hypothetical protein
MNIDTIRRDLKDVGYAVVLDLLTSEQLEAARIVSFRSLFNKTKNPATSNPATIINNLRNPSLLRF